MKTNIIKERHILILYTGGTIGMCKGENGLIPKKNFLYEYMLNHPNLCDKEETFKRSDEKMKNNPEILVTPITLSKRRVFYSIYEFEEIIDSSNMNIDYWKLVGGSIFKSYNDYDAFIILHGTDTMNYTASILSFMFENLNKPVIITGSQIPLSEMRNDGLKNLVDAIIIAGAYHIPEVTLMFDSMLLRGNRTIKYDNMSLNAFESPNLIPLVEMGINIKVNWDIILPPPTEEFVFFENINDHITVIKLFPLIQNSTFESYFKPSIRAVIIETFGIEHFLKFRSNFCNIIRSAIERGVIVIEVSQCRKGFFPDIKEEQYGIIYAGDMTVECCLAKASYLLGKGYDMKTFHKLFKENLRGEISTDHQLLYSNRIVDALVEMINDDKKNEENKKIAVNLLPSIIIDLVDKNKLQLLKKLKLVIKTINFNSKSFINRRNPLHYAAIEGNFEIVKFLINCRININEIDSDNCTPLNYACMNKKKDVALLIKENGGILNQYSDLSQLFCSYAYEGDLESIQLFYECGANLMVGDYDKRTLAHIAASNGKIDIINFLINCTNLNIMIEDRWGSTPLEKATPEIKDLILAKLGSNTNIKLYSKKKKKNYRTKCNNFHN